MHVPHYCHMFEGIMAGPRPWRFGHVYLPGGSEALGTPAAAIQPLQSASRCCAEEDNVPHRHLCRLTSAVD